MQNKFRKPVGEALVAYFSLTVFRGTREGCMRCGPKALPTNGLIQSITTHVVAHPPACNFLAAEPPPKPHCFHLLSSAQRSFWSSLPDAFVLPGLCPRILDNGPRLGPQSPHMASDVLSHREEGTALGKMHSQEPWLPAMPHPSWAPYFLLLKPSFLPHQTELPPQAEILMTNPPRSLHDQEGWAPYNGTGMQANSSKCPLQEGRVFCSNEW